MLENLSPQEIKNQFKENKSMRMVTFGVTGLIILILGYFAYKKFWFGPAEEKSRDAYYHGLNLAAKDSTDAAIDLLRPVAKEYDGKDGGEIAQFVLARQYMEKGKFQKALEELEGVNFDDTYLAVYAVGLQGDCYSEMKKYTEAMDLYIEAAELNENEKTSPEYLFKAALVAEELKDFEKATELYQRIKDNYLTFSNNRTLDKYLARVKNKKSK